MEISGHWSDLLIQIHVLRTGYNDICFNFWLNYGYANLITHSVKMGSGKGRNAMALTLGFNL